MKIPPPTINAAKANSRVRPDELERSEGAGGERQFQQGAGKRRPNGKKKRRPDGRAIRETKTYMVAELADAARKSPQTVYDWIDQGLRTIDDLSPAMVYGYVARAWLDENWGRRRHKLAIGVFYCCSCQEPRGATLNSIHCDKRPDGAVVCRGNCLVCDAAMYRTVKANEVAFFLEAAADLPTDVKRFNDSYITSASPESDAGSHTPPESISMVVEKRRHRAALLPRNPGNERLKHAFFEERHNVDGRSLLSIRVDETALLRFESYFKFRDFSKLSKDEAIAFKNDLRASGLTLPVVVATLAAISVFLEWLSERDGYKRRISLKNVKYLQVTRKERRSVRPSEKIKRYPTPEQADLAIMTMPTTSPTQIRNRTIICVLGVTAMRVGAIIALRIKDVDLDEGIIHQRVNTKFGKPIDSVMIPIRAHWIEFIKDYINLLYSLGYSEEDFLFPRVEVKSGPGAEFGEKTLSKHPMSDAQMIGRMVQEAFAAVGLRFGPHSFRNMQWRIAEDAPPRVAHAFSLNLGHGSSKVSFDHYGRKSLEERRNLIHDHFAKADDQRNKIIDDTIEALTKLKGGG